MKTWKKLFNMLRVLWMAAALTCLRLIIPHNAWAPPPPAPPCDPGCTGTPPNCNCPGQGSPIPLGADDAILGGIILYGAYKLKKKQKKN